jgi:hypothetical protein
MSTGISGYEEGEQEGMIMMMMTATMVPTDQ